MPEDDPTQLLLYRGECLLGRIALDPSRDNFPWSFGLFSAAPEFSAIKPLFEDELRFVRAREHTEHARVWNEIEAPGLKLVQVSTQKAWKVALIHIAGDQANWRLRHEA
jgi:hypothetical protein